MLHKRLVQFLVVGCSLVGFLQAHAQTNFRNPIKLNVEKDDVEVLKDGFLIFTNKGGVMVKTLRSDANGLYVFERDFLEKGPNNEEDGYTYVCWTCGRMFCRGGAINHARQYENERDERGNKVHQRFDRY